MKKLLTAIVMTIAATSSAMAFTANGYWETNAYAATADGYPAANTTVFSWFNNSIGYQEIAVKFEHSDRCIGRPNGYNLGPTNAVMNGKFVRMIGECHDQSSYFTGDQSYDRDEWLRVTARARTVDMTFPNGFKVIYNANGFQRAVNWRW